MKLNKDKKYMFAGDVCRWDSFYLKWTTGDILFEDAKLEQYASRGFVTEFRDPRKGCTTVQFDQFGSTGLNVAYMIRGPLSHRGSSHIADNAREFVNAKFKVTWEEVLE